jgi:hypothetical protein
MLQAELMPTRRELIPPFLTIELLKLSCPIGCDRFTVSLTLPSADLLTKQAIE